MAEQRLLLVDDEPALLKLMHRYLDGLGYRVDVCGNAADACRKFAEQGPGYYALVLTDMSLPDMKGDALLERLLALDPEARILICSGYPFEVSRLPGKVPNQFGFLQKPFLPKMLTEAVSRLVAGKSVQTR